jgi:hypothetical protein
MAPPNNNSNPPNGPAQNNAPQGPAQVGPRQTPNPLQSSIDALGAGTPQLKDIADLLTKIGDLLSKNEQLGQSVRKGYQDSTSELRKGIQFLQEQEEAYEKIKNYTHMIRKDGIKASDYREVVKTLKDMEKLNRSQLENGVYGKKQTILIKRNIAEIGRALNTIKIAPDNPMSPEKMRDVLELMQRITAETIRTGKSMKGVRLNTLNQDAASASRSIRHLFQIQDNKSAKFSQYRNTAKKIRQAHNNHVAGSHENAKERRDRIISAASESGLLTSDSSRAERREFAKRAAAQARKEGMGRLGSRIMGRHAADTAAGAESNVVTRMGTKVLARGEGSIGHGVASMAMGALESGAAALAESALPELAAVYEGVKFVHKQFNRSQEKNAGVADALGGSGIYNSTGTSLFSGPLGSINQVRHNLNGSIYSSLGIGYEKNLAIAKSLADSGFSNTNLASGDLKEDNHGFASGSFGTMQRNVYAYGRMAGLDPSQTMDQTIKLISQYRQSLGSTEDFFVRINKDTRAAGMSTMKYIQLIDEVNSHYDRSNKLLEATVDTMRLLSVTGRNTAEDLKDALDVTTGGSSDRPLEVKAFLAQQMFSNKGDSANYQAVFNGDFNKSLDNASSAMGPGYSADSLRSRIEKGGNSAIDQLLQEAKTNLTRKDGTIDSTAYQSTSGALERAREAFAAKERFDVFSKQGGAAGAVGFAQGTETQGNNILSQRMLNALSIQTAMRLTGHSIAETQDPTSNAKMQGDPALQKLLTSLGVDPKKANKLMTSTIFDIVSAKIQGAQNGLSNVDPNSAAGKASQAGLEKMYDQLEANGVTGLNKTGNKVTDLSAYAKTSDGQGKMMDIFKKDPNIFKDIGGGGWLDAILKPKVEQSDREEGIANAQKLSAATRTTADIWASAFESLFNKLQTPLDFIADLLSHLKWPGSAGVASVSEIQSLKDALDNGQSANAIANLNKELEGLAYDLKNGKAGVSHADLQKEYDKKKDQLDKISSTDNTLNSGNSKFLLEGNATATLAAIRDNQKVDDGTVKSVDAKAAAASSPIDMYKHFTDASLNTLTPVGGAAVSGGNTIINNTTHNNSVGYVAAGDSASSAVNKSGDVVPLQKAK